jgi:hypothetical protein
MNQNMSIDIDWLENELNSCDEKINIESFISKLVILALENNNDSMKKIAECHESVITADTDIKTKEIFDALSHAFTVFLSGGMHDLYVYQENETWHPKILLRQEMEPNDIPTLSESIQIYRGCDISEFIDRKYGQSWSTSVNVAEEFAYQHYASHSWYDKDKRCVLTATIKKEDVYFSRQDHHEREIAVNTGKLINIKNIIS